MNQRLLAAPFLAFGIGQACVGDSPAGSDGTTADPDGGQQGSTGGPPVTGGSTTLTLAAEPLQLVHGQSGSVHVTIAQQGSGGRFSLTLRSNLPGLQAAGTATLEASERNAVKELAFTSLVSAPVGQTDVTVLVVATDENGGESQVPVSLFVRGTPGELDTSFGAEGVATSPVSGATLVDAVAAADGSIYAIGNNPPTTVAYTSDGKLRDDFGANGVLAVDLPKESGNGPGSFGMARDNADGTISVAARTFEEGVAYRLQRFDTGLSAPFAAAFVPPSKPTGSLGNSCDKREWLFPYKSGYRSILDADSGNCFGPPVISAHDGAGASDPSFTASGFTKLDPGDGNYTKVLSVRAIGNMARIITDFGEVQSGATYYVHHRALTSVNLDVAQVSRIQLGTHTRASGEGKIDFFLSEPKADGSILAIRSNSAAPCIVSILPSGALDPAFSSACIASDTGDGRYTGGTYLAAGGFVVTALGAVSSMWTSADGASLSDPLALPSLVSGPNGQIVHVFEAASGRVVILTSDPDGKKWNVRRYWL